MCEVNAFGCRLQVVIHSPPLSPSGLFPAAPSDLPTSAGRFVLSGKAFPERFHLTPRPRYLFGRQSGADVAAPRLGQGDGTRRWKRDRTWSMFSVPICSGCLSLSISREKSCPPVISEIKSDRLCRKVLRMNLPAESVTFHATGANQIFLKVYVVAALWSLSSISSKRTSCVPVNCSIRKVP